MYRKTNRESQKLSCNKGKKTHIDLLLYGNDNREINRIVGGGGGGGGGGGEGGGGRGSLNLYIFSLADLFT